MNQKHLPRMELSVVLMLHDLNDLGPLILIDIPHKCNLKRAQSRYFELFWPHTKLPLNGRKPENNSFN